MALTVCPAEPAESYISVVDADAYFLARSNAAWAALNTTAKEANLRLATDYMEQVYTLRWSGFRKTDTQALSWPRAYVPRLTAIMSGTLYWPDNVVPVIVANACAELALRAATTPLAPDIGRLKNRTKVGPLEVWYDPNGIPYTQYRAIDNMLAQFLSGAGGASRAVVRT